MAKRMKVDVVVIGSGIGGMLCGCLLGREGYKVVILERMTHPGGRYTTIEHDGFKINTGSWAVGLHGTNGPLWKLMSDLGARIEIKVPQPIHARLWVKGKDLALPPKGQLGFILETISKSKKEYERVMNAVRKALKWQEPSDEMTCDQWLHQYTDNPLIHGQFNFFTRAMTGTYYDVFPAGEYFRLLRGFGQFGSLTAMPKNGQKTTIDALLKLLKQWSVYLFLETHVQKIVCAGGKVDGVIAAQSDGDSLEIDSNIVISNAGPKETVKLAGPANFDKGFLKEIDFLEPTRAVVNVFGYKKQILNYESHIQFIDMERLGTAWEPCHIWPEYAPPGMQCLYTYSTMKTTDTRKELPLIIDECKSRFPVLEKATVVSTLVFKEDWPVLRARPTRCLDIRTPVYGLYLAGDAVNISGWTCGEGISFSCRAIAEDIKRRLPKVG